MKRELEETTRSNARLEAEVQLRRSDDGEASREKGFSRQQKGRDKGLDEQTSRRQSHSREA